MSSSTAPIQRLREIEQQLILQCLPLRAIALTMRVQKSWADAACHDHVVKYVPISHNHQLGSAPTCEIDLDKLFLSRLGQHVRFGTVVVTGLHDLYDCSCTSCIIIKYYQIEEIVITGIDYTAHKLIRYEPNRYTRMRMFLRQLDRLHNTKLRFNFELLEITNLEDVWSYFSQMPNITQVAFTSHSITEARVLMALLADTFPNVEVLTIRMPNLYIGMDSALPSATFQHLQTFTFNKTCLLTAIQSAPNLTHISTESIINIYGPFIGLEILRFPSIAHFNIEFVPLMDLHRIVDILKETDARNTTLFIRMSTILPREIFSCTNWAISNPTQSVINRKVYEGCIHQASLSDLQNIVKQVVNPNGDEPVVVSVLLLQYMLQSINTLRQAMTFPRLHLSFKMHLSHIVNYGMTELAQWVKKERPDWDICL
jgi:hypothetical protein